MSKPTKDQLVAFKKAKSKEELIAMAKDAGVELIQKTHNELSEAELVSISGGVQGTERQVVTPQTECLFGFTSSLYCANVETGEETILYSELIHCSFCGVMTQEDGVCYCNYAG